MKNQSKTSKAVPKLPQVNPDEDPSVEYQSLKSVRGQKKENEGMEQASKVQSDGVPSTTEPEKKEPQEVSVWQCPECKYVNKFGDSYECGNTRRCKFNLGYYEDLASCMISLTQEEFEKKEKKQKEEMQQEDKPIQDNEWICDKCQHKNLMSHDPNSCLCKKCKSKNDVIEYMIKAQSDTMMSKAEQQYLDHYNKHKNDPQYLQQQKQEMNNQQPN